MEVPHVSVFCKVGEASPEESPPHLWKDIKIYNLFSTVGQVLFLFL